MEHHPHSNMGHCPHQRQLDLHVFVLLVPMRLVAARCAGETGENAAKDVSLRINGLPKAIWVRAGPARNAGREAKARTEAKAEVPALWGKCAWGGRAWGGRGPLDVGRPRRHGSFSKTVVQLDSCQLRVPERKAVLVCHSRVASRCRDEPTHKQHAYLEGACAFPVGVD